jgi:hypothetical protein
VPLVPSARRRAALLPALAACVAGIVLLHALLLRIARLRLDGAEAGAPAGAGAASSGSGWLDAVAGLLAQTTAPQFYGSALAGLGMIAGAGAAHLAASRRSRWRGFDVAYGTRLWPWVLAAAGLALILSDLLWGRVQLEGQWGAAFSAFVSAAPAIVLIYGPGWRTAVTGAVLGTLTTPPLVLLLVAGAADPLGLPRVAGSVAAMALGALASFLICRALPWMRAPAPLPPRRDVQVEANLIAEQGAVGSGGRRWWRRRGRRRVRGFGMHDALWLPRRALADFTEAQFYGSEWASLGLIGGMLLGWWWTLPAGADVSALIPDVLAAQLLAACLAAWLYADRWSAEGWYPTFVPIVSLVPAAVLDLGGGWPVILAASVLGAVIGPVLARRIARLLPVDFHPFIGSVAAMCLLTAGGVPVLRLLL